MTGSNRPVMAGWRQHRDEHGRNRGATHPVQHCVSAEGESEALFPEATGTFAGFQYAWSIID